MHLKYQDLNRMHVDSETDSFSEDRYRQFFRFFPDHAKSVLDLGCNIGRGGCMLKQIDPSLRIWGFDCLQERLDRVPPGVFEDTICGLAHDIPVGDCRFDVVVAGEILEHIYPVDVMATLAEVFRVLKIGGRLLLTTPNPAYVRRRIRRESVLGGAHVSQHRHQTMRMMLRLIGFTGIRIYGSGKASRILGYRTPFLSLYGSYMAVGDKH
jgi:ubiquinone/menaquinone biosynthesis C-methylase UbiE